MDYGSIDLDCENAQAATTVEAADVAAAPKRRISTTSLLSLVASLAIGGMLLILNGTYVSENVADVTLDQTAVPDCQCLSTCDTPDSSHEGTWCYINGAISPCMDSTRRTIFGQAWARCEVVYGADNCAGNPCENSAVCVDQYNGYECICRPGWSGETCDTPVNVEYEIAVTSSDASDAGTESPIFFMFTGTEGDTTLEEMVRDCSDPDTPCPKSDRVNPVDDEDGDPCNDDVALTENPGYWTKTVIAADVGTLNRVTYRAMGTDSFDPAKIQITFKGTVYVAVGDLPASANNEPVRVSLMEAREYTLDFTTIDEPGWASTNNDIYMQLTGEDWQVSGATVVLPNGVSDGCEKTVTFMAGDVGTPQKVTYWVRDDDSVLPSSIVIDNRYAAQITTGDRCYGQYFVGDSDNGRGYAFEDADCAGCDDDTDEECIALAEATGGCTHIAGCRWCVTYDPLMDDDNQEVLCPWALPYSDGRYIIVDLTDLEPEEEATVEEEESTGEEADVEEEEGE